MCHERCESHFGTNYRKLYGLPPYYYYQRHALRFHAHVRVTLYVIFSVGVPSIARSVTSDAERAHVLWNAAYVASSRILRHKGPKYGVRLDVPTDAQSATLRLSSMLGIACSVAFQFVLDVYRQSLRSFVATIVNDRRTNPSRC